MQIAMIGQKGVPSAYGGIETHVTELATRLVREGFAVVSYGRTWYSGNQASDRYNGIRLIILPSLHTKHLDAITHTLLATLHACFIVRPDIYHFHGVGPSLMSWIPRILAPKARVITTFHCIDRHHAKWNSFARFMLGLGEKACLSFADECIVVSRTLQKYTAIEYGHDTNYIPNGITPRRTTADILLLSPFNLQSYHYVAMVSRLVPHKGAHTLIDAWQKARALNPLVMRDLKLAIVGDSAFTDAYVQALKIQAINDSSIVFTGYQNGETLEALFTGARFTINPSTSEGLPIAVLEAMSYGKAVIASDIPAHLEIVSDYGVPFITGNVDDLATKIVDLAADQMQAASLGHLARTFVEQDYNWDDIALQTVAVYSKPALAAAAVLATE
jgi:glycosyltransferase involved in cell wall biosynthesis